MQATVLVILYQGQETLAVYDDDSIARRALLDFVDQRWRNRFGQLPLPHNGDERVRTFFAGDDIYLLASTDVTDIVPCYDSQPSNAPSSNE